MTPKPKGGGTTARQRGPLEKTVNQKIGGIAVVDLFSKRKYTGTKLTEYLFHNPCNSY